MRFRLLQIVSRASFEEWDEGQIAIDENLDRYSGMFQESIEGFLLVGIALGVSKIKFELTVSSSLLASFLLRFSNISASRLCLPSAPADRAVESEDGSFPSTGISLTVFRGDELVILPVGPAASGDDGSLCSVSSNA